jgi:hypothetical protein
LREIGYDLELPFAEELAEGGRGVSQTGIPLAGAVYVLSRCTQDSAWVKTPFAINAFAKALDYPVQAF